MIRNFRGVHPNILNLWRLITKTLVYRDFGLKHTETKLLVDFQNFQSPDSAGSKSRPLSYTWEPQDVNFIFWYKVRKL